MMSGHTLLTCTSAVQLLHCVCSHHASAVAPLPGAAPHTMQARTKTETTRTCVFVCRRLRTRFIEATHNPVWNERFEVYLADEAETFKLSIKVCAAQAAQPPSIPQSPQAAGIASSPSRCSAGRWMRQGLGA